MAAPVGAVVSIAPYDWGTQDAPPAAGDFLLSNGGTAYRILASRATRRLGRFALTCLKIGRAADIPPSARTLGLHWYPRQRTRGGA